VSFVRHGGDASPRVPTIGSHTHHANDVLSSYSPLLITPSKDVTFPSGTLKLPTVQHGVLTMLEVLSGDALDKI